MPFKPFSRTSPCPRRGAPKSFCTDDVANCQTSSPPAGGRGPNVSCALGTIYLLLLDQTTTSSKTVSDQFHSDIYLHPVIVTWYEARQPRSFCDYNRPPGPIHFPEVRNLTFPQRPALLLSVQRNSVSAFSTCVPSSSLQRANSSTEWPFNRHPPIGGTTGFCPTIKLLNFALLAASLGLRTIRTLHHTLREGSGCSLGPVQAVLAGSSSLNPSFNHCLMTFREAVTSCLANPEFVNRLVCGGITKTTRRSRLPGPCKTSRLHPSHLFLARL